MSNAFVTVVFPAWVFDFLTLKENMSIYWTTFVIMNTSLNYIPMHKKFLSSFLRPYIFRIGCCETTLEVAQKILPFYKEYFQVTYPLPKIDRIAITDFAAGMLFGCV